MSLIERVWLEERLAGPTLGIGDRAPRVSWLLAEDAEQIAYQLEITASSGRVDLLDTEESASGRLIEWPAAELGSRESVTIRVRVETSDGRSDWSAPFAFETGLLERDDWEANFVSPSLRAPSDGPRPGYLLRAQFEVDQTFVRARVYSTAHGVYELELNGEKVNADVLAPGWTSYNHELRYQTIDVTASIVPGTNVVGAWLADGWYRGRLGFNGGLWNNYGEDVALLLQLELTDVDGVVTTVQLNESWRFEKSPIDSTGLYEGESYDARKEPHGWSTAGFDASAWQKAHVLDLSAFEATLEAPDGPPVREIERLAPVAIDRLANGRVRLDFGQNVAGKLQLAVDAPSGHQIRIHHAEELDAGELAIRSLRTAPSIDTFIGDGRGLRTWTPRFTLHGFRYAEVENWPGDLDATSVEALVVHTDMARTGWFESSNPLLNRLHDNVVWSMRGNFVDLPTDCPQRDERLGWTGDIQVFAPTASFLYSVYGTLQGWLRDVASEQAQFGSVPNFVPWIECGFPSDPAAAWGDAAVIVPWVLYERYGDTSVLREQYDSMRAWVEQVAQLAGDREVWDEGFQLGDWLDPVAPPDNPAASTTDKYLVATAYRARSTRILAQTAALLGHSSDAERYSAMAARVDTAFRAEYVTPSGRLASDTPTAYALALTFDLLEPGQRVTAGRRLADLVAESGYHITSGFVGTPIICDALAATGSVDAAYHLLMQEELPSWLYPVTMGATTIWERWDSLLPDGSINPGEMTSFNHYALGAVADFMHRVVAGLSPQSPGYETLRFAPRPGGGLRSASASHVTPYGRASSSWTRSGDRFELQVEVPIGHSATVSMPDGSDEFQVGGGSHAFECVLRAPDDDPAMPPPFNIHNPEHRAARELAL